MSTKSVNLNIRTNKELKESVGKILDDLGLDHSTVVNMLYHQIEMLQAIPFPVRIPNLATRHAVAEPRNDVTPPTDENSEELSE